MIVQVSNDESFSKGVITLFNNDYDDSFKLGKGNDTSFYSRWWGEIVDARNNNKGTNARYIRIYTGRSTNNELPRYVEIAVFAKK